MKLLSNEQIKKIVSLFGQGDLFLKQTIDFEPDCKIYILEDQAGESFALICRDFQFDDLEAEKRILKNEARIVIIDRLKQKEAYWTRAQEFDDFEYVFSLSRCKSLAEFSL